MATLSDFLSTPRPPVRIFPPDAFFYRRVDTLPVHPLSADIIADCAYLMPSGLRAPRASGSADWSGNWNTGFHINGDWRTDYQVQWLSRPMQLNPYGADRATHPWADGTRADGWWPSVNSKILVTAANANAPWGSGDKDAMTLAKRTQRGYSESASVNSADCETTVNWDTGSLARPRRARYPQYYAGTTASKVPGVAFKLWREELQRGIASHMLWMSAHNAVVNDYVWPAGGTDGVAAGGGFRGATHLKEGMVLRLKRSFNVEAATTHEMLRTILRTAKVQGVFVGDKTGLDDAMWAQVIADPVFNSSTWPSTSVVQWSDFEVVDFEQVKVADDSLQAVF